MSSEVPCNSENSSSQFGPNNLGAAQITVTTPGSHTALFRDVRLSQWNDGLAFRQKCESDETMKGKIQSLELPFTDDWMQWFKWTFSVADMPSVETLKIYGLARIRFMGMDTLNYNLSDIFQFASDSTPNLRLLMVSKIPAATFFTAAPLPALRQLNLTKCPVNGELLQALARDLPVLETLHLYLPPDGSLKWDCIEALTKFPQLATLDLDGQVVFDALTPPGPGQDSEYEFNSLGCLYLHQTQGITNWEILKHLSLPKLEYMGVTVSQTSPNLAAAATFFTSPVRIPHLLCVDFVCYADPIIEAPGYDPVPVRMDELISPLRTWGFCFTLIERLGLQRVSKSWCWSAVRGDYKGCT